MTILFSCVADGSNIIAKTGKSNLEKFISKLLERVERGRKSYEHEGYVLSCNLASNIPPNSSRVKTPQFWLGFGFLCFLLLGSDIHKLLLF
jgi:hypothetical protein